MKHYYYADNDQQLGPFSFDELKTKRLKKTTLVWTEGMQDWAMADSINELKEILMSTPPPLPKKSNAPQAIETVHIKRSTKPKTSKKYDLAYEKETDATVFGILLIIFSVILSLTGAITFETIESYNQGRAIIAIISLVLRIAITVWVVNIATRQNRNSTGWGWFAFFFPLLALIVIGLLKKLRLKIELDDSLSDNEKVAILLEKANRLFASARYTECKEVLDKSIELDDKNLECIRLRGLTNYQLNSLENSKADFETLVKAESFLSEAYYCLGNIEIQKHNREKAVTFWQQAIEENNENAQVKLDLYNNFTGKYLLNNSQIIRKLTSNYDIFFAGCKYIGGFTELDQSEKLSKLKTELKGNDNGLEVKLRRTFKSYHLAIAYYEIDNIIYNDSDKKLELLLADKNILRFEYSQAKNEYNNGLEKFCIRYMEKTGKEPKAFFELARLKTAGNSQHK